MKKQIVIVTRRMITGGVERALIAMLKQFDYNEVDVDLYVELEDGELYEEIPKNIQVHLLPTVHGKNAMVHPYSTIKKLMSKMKLKTKMPYLEQNLYYSKMLLPLKKRYDIAIAYHAPNTVPVFYVINQIKAKKKILWLHGNMETNAGDEMLAIKYHSCFDQVFAVSKSVYDSFLKYHPDMEKKTDIFYNFVDVDGIKKKAKQGHGFEDDFKGIRILSIGRLDKQKGFDIAINICIRLCQNGYQFKWYVCGEGTERKALEMQIEKYCLKDVFILLGNQSNPYTYLKDCDLYVQPSRCEGYCTTTNEARMLSKPVITTDVSGSREQFVDGETGWIVPIEENAIYERIKWCIENPQAMKEVSERLGKINIASDNKIAMIFK